MPILRRATLISLHFAEYVTHLAFAIAETVPVQLFLYRQNVENELGADWAVQLAKPNLELVVLERPRTSLQTLTNARLILKHIKDFQPDILHYQEDPRDEIIFSLPFLSRYPKLLTIHDPSRHSGRDAKLSRITFYFKIIRAYADGVITHGNRLVDEVLALHPRFQNKVWSIAHGPLGQGFEGNQAIKPEGFRLLFFGRIHAYKGLTYFIDAVIALRAKGYPVVGVVAGKGSDLEQYRQKMAVSGGFEIIDQFIPASDVPTLFLESYITVLPYTDGTQSGVAAMALGFGRPVVASAVGSIPELVRSDINGLLVPPQDSAQLTAALEKILIDPVLWSQLANGALALKNGELSWQAIAQQTLAAYNTCLSPK